ncbi:MAG: hypothetical protein V2A73_18380 [Pseudomonadota bacterium]
MFGHREIAGVSLARPAKVYQASHPSFGTARLRRSETDMTLRIGTLAIDLDEQVAHLCGQSVDRVSFPLGEMLPFWVFYQYGQTASVESWRSLIVAHRLLSTPELILSADARSAWKQTPGVTEADSTALDDLAERYGQIVRPKVRHHGMECDACRAARVRRLEQERASYQRLRLERALSGLWGPVPISNTSQEHLQDCVHYPVACAALDHVCRSHPELIFELLGVLEPGGNRWACNAAVPTETRFLLERNVVEIIIGHWLLGKSPSRRESYDYHPFVHGYRPPSSGRRFQQERRPAQTAGTNDRLPETLRRGLAYSVASWGIQSRVEDLSLSVSSRASSESEGNAPLSMLGGSKPTPLAATRILPELPPHSNRK